MTTAGLKRLARCRSFSLLSVLITVKCPRPRAQSEMLTFLLSNVSNPWWNIRITLAAENKPTNNNNNKTLQGDILDQFSQNL